MENFKNNWSDGANQIKEIANNQMREIRTKTDLLINKFESLRIFEAISIKDFNFYLFLGYFFSLKLTDFFN